MPQLDDELKNEIKKGVKLQSLSEEEKKKIEEERKKRQEEIEKVKKALEKQS